MPITTLFGSTPRCAVELESDASSGESVAIVRTGAEINEGVDYKVLSDALKALPGPVTRVRFDTKRTRRINSPGARAWIQLMDEVQRTLKIEFTYVSEPFMELASMLPGMLGTPRAELGQVEVPYFCGNCDQATSPSFGLSEILKDRLVTLPKTKCVTCGGPIEVDIDEDEYFSVLTRVRAG